MFRFGITCPLAHSHMNNMLLLGQLLQQRGHAVTVFHSPDMAAKVGDAKLAYHEIGAAEFPMGSLAQIELMVRNLSGWKALWLGVDLIARFSAVVCRDVPPAARDIDVMLVDQDEPGGGSVADLLGIPFVTVSNALPINTEPGVPPVYTDWPYSEVPLSRLRNRFCYWTALKLTRSINERINAYRRQWGLRRLGGVGDALSRVAQLSQVPPAFDFPRKAKPESLRYVGPFRSPNRQNVPFPWERLDGRKIIYASLGTFLSGKLDVFERIAEACSGLEAQLVISHVGCLHPEQADILSQRALVVPYAPQYELLKTAHLTISHGGLNTVLDSLSHGVPVVAIPKVNDAPGVGARLEWSGAGKAVPWSKVHDPHRLRQAIHEVFSNESYARAAKRIQDSIQSAGGLATALSIIEQVATTHAGTWTRKAAVRP